MNGLDVVSWLIVFIPFILMTVIVSMLLVMFGLDPSTGKLAIAYDKTMPERQDVRARARRVRKRRHKLDRFLPKNTPNGESTMNHKRLILDMTSQIFQLTKKRYWMMLFQQGLD